MGVPGTCRLTMRAPMHTPSEGPDMKTLQFTIAHPIEMGYDRGSRELTLRGATAQGDQLEIRLDANATWSVASGIESAAKLIGPLGIEPPARSVQ